MSSVFHVVRRATVRVMIGVLSHYIRPSRRKGLYPNPENGIVLPSVSATVLPLLDPPVALGDDEPSGASLLSNINSPNSSSGSLKGRYSSFAASTSSGESAANGSSYNHAPLARCEIARGSRQVNPLFHPKPPNCTVYLTSSISPVSAYVARLAARNPGSSYGRKWLACGSACAFLGHC